MSALPMLAFVIALLGFANSYYLGSAVPGYRGSNQALGVAFIAVMVIHFLSQTIP